MPCCSISVPARFLAMASVTDTIAQLSPGGTPFENSSYDTAFGTTTLSHEAASRHSSRHSGV